MTEEAGKQGKGKQEDILDEPLKEEKGDAEEQAASTVQAPSPEEGLKDQLLRLRADFDNYRKRTEAERARLSKYALEPASLNLLDVLDDMERALASPEHGDEEWRRGVNLMHQKLLAALEAEGVKSFESLGQEFDPHYHEAVSASSSPDAEVDEVVDEVQKGYMLHDRVIRHAKVVVVIPPEEKMSEMSEMSEKSEESEEKNNDQE